MLIYEKDNKLNINFENKIEEPDFSIYKNGEDKVVISANGETSEAGSNNSGESVLPPYTVEDAEKSIKSCFS